MHTSSRGFSLIEILVGLVIGLIGMVVMLQVFTSTEAGKRTTSGSDEAQNGGAIALYSLQRDIRQAGYGITNLTLIGCNLTLPSGVVINNIAPVTINHPAIPNGDANTDTILTISGNSNGAQQGDKITAQPAANTPRTYTMASTAVYEVNNQIIAQVFTAPPPAASLPCNLKMEPITSITAGTSNINVAVGLPGASNGTIFNMGSAPRIIAYAVRGGDLTTCDFMQSNCTQANLTSDITVWVPITGNVVSLRADYGQDLTNTTFPGKMDAAVDTYDQATPLSNCGLSRVLTTRLAIVTRNASYDKAVVTSTAPTWMGTANAPIVLNGTDTNWDHYRYKLFQTEIPLRNIIGIANGYAAMGASSPC